LKTDPAETKVSESHPWTPQDAISVYNIDKWGAGYFGVSPAGNLTVAPLAEKGATIELTAVIREALARGLRLPLVVRFQDILRSRVEGLNEAFARAIAENRYNGVYRGVFPIKVNQLREVVEEIIDAGRPYSHGIEVGSKPEIYAGLAIHDDPDALIVCNGYKDEQMIRMAFFGRRLGKKIILVAEKLSEIRMIVRVAKETGTDPIIGIRIRLQARGSGKWATSAGENAKFGLSTNDLISAIELLREAGLESSFKLLHFHIGSQVPNILTIKRAVREAARYWAKLRRMGLELEYFDVGGGLAVDYDGSRSNFHSSMNYSMQEYANDIVYNIMDVCDAEGVPHPTIVSESGRAIVAPHAVLVVEAFGSIEKTPVEPFEAAPGDHKLIRDLAYIQSTLTRRNLSEPFHDLLQIREEAQQMFGLGLLELPDKAKIESLYWGLARRIVEMYRGQPYVPEEIKELENQLADQYICNFSVFQSLLDHWANGQLFPIMPIHRLDEAPTQNSTLVDITCDSDGKVSKFIDLVDEKDTLLLHAITDDEPYWVGFFMVGAYQDIMGDLHNLFGRVNEAHVFLDPDEEEGYYIEETIPGNTIAEVLGMTQYPEVELARKMKAQVDLAIKQDRLRPNEGMRLLDEYEKGLRDQTYLELGHP
jgi:arginine decarboxylase